jgi:hypothetical protein
MRLLQFLSIFLFFSACEPAPNEMAYDLKSGNKVFLRAVKESDKELANKQAIYLGKNYEKDAIAKNAPDVLNYLNQNNINADSLLDVEDQRMQIVSQYNISSTADAYEKIHIAFEGMPEISVVKPMLEDVMKRSNIEITNDNILKCANVLVVLRKDSKIGVTEMQILKHMYQNGRSSGMDYANQAAVSSFLIEKTQ